jgi:hypothetical protein
MIRLPLLSRYASLALTLALLGGCAPHRPETAVPGPRPGARLPRPRAPGRTRPATPGPPVPLYEPRADAVTNQPLSRPLAVMIENSPAARPQSGLAAAAVVYEALSEGGITRFLAVFNADTAPVIGPIRSARPAFVDLMQPFAPIYVHCGQSWEAEKVLAKRKLAEINELKVKSPFWRDPRRRSPHNLYASTASLDRAARRLGLTGGLSDWPLPVDDLPIAGKPASSVSIPYRFGQRYLVRYDYNDSDRSYARFINGQPHLDAATQEPLTANTVIVQETATRPVGNRYGELAMKVVGAGRCWFVRDGRWTAGRWVKEAPDVPTVYETADGAPLQVAPGATWIQIVPAGTRPGFTR